MSPHLAQLIFSGPQAAPILLCGVYLAVQLSGQTIPLQTVSNPIVSIMNKTTVVDATVIHPPLLENTAVSNPLNSIMCHEYYA